MEVLLNKGTAIFIRRQVYRNREEFFQDKNSNTLLSIRALVRFAVK